MKSGYTEGIVIDVQRAERFDNRMCTGLFVVKSETPGRDFADFGDSGAAVIDKEKGELVGMVIGIVGTEDNAQWIEKTALCLKLDYTLKYIEKEWQLKLSFNQIAEPSDQNEVTICFISLCQQQKSFNFKQNTYWFHIIYM